MQNTQRILHILSCMLGFGFLGWLGDRQFVAKGRGDRTGTWRHQHAELWQHLNLGKWSKDGWPYELFLAVVPLHYIRKVG